MKPKGVWLSGLCSLALVCAGGLYMTLPQIQHDVQTRVDATLKAKGLSDVKATVSGQSVTLAATTDSPASDAHLAQARVAILDIHQTMIHDGRLPHAPGDLPGGQIVNGVVTEVAVNAPPPAPEGGAAAPMAQIPAWPASADAAGAPPEIAGEKATTIASSSAGTPPVAGDSARLASDTVALSGEAKACQDQIAHFLTPLREAKPARRAAKPVTRPSPTAASNNQRNSTIRYTMALPLLGTNGNSDALVQQPSLRRRIVGHRRRRTVAFGIDA